MPEWNQKGEVTMQYPSYEVGCCEKVQFARSPMKSWQQVVVRGYQGCGERQ